MVIVNKMDDPTVRWSKERFDEIRDALEPYLNSIGYTNDTIQWIPISGLKGDNITARSKQCKWYIGLTLIEALDGVDLPN